MHYSVAFNIPGIVSVLFLTQDILENDNIKLDWMFKRSFIWDLIKVQYSSC